jgi:hypothetical protein
MTDELTTLAQRLGVEPGRLTALASYDGSEIGRLDAAVERAMAKDDHTFREALEHALTLVPRMLRGTAQKLLDHGGHHG